MIILLASAGQVIDSERIKLNVLDKMYVELYVAVSFFIRFLVINGIYFIPNRTIRVYFELFLNVLIIYVVVIGLLITLLKRIRSHTLVKTLLSVQLILNITVIYRPVLGLIAIALVYNRFIRYDFGYMRGTGLFLFDILIFVLLCAIILQFGILKQAIKQLSRGDYSHKTAESNFYLDFKEEIQDLNKISEGIEAAVEARLSAERLKTELITNVSHDIKTPLTSIINYVDLMKKEDISNEKVHDYLEVLDRKSQRLKALIDDLIEASKAGTGNIVAKLERIDAVELISQVVGDFEEQFELKSLELILNLPVQEIYVSADGSHLSRIVENLFSNAAKYSMNSSRIYADMKQEGTRVYFTLKNISNAPLNIPIDELMDRFVRGDRARYTEGSGLGLYIARSLAQIMGGEIQLTINGDLFEAVVVMKGYEDAHNEG